jgi:hypothetical protein
MSLIPGVPKLKPGLSKRNKKDVKAFSAFQVALVIISIE